jgi:hypothetical protein
MKKNNLRKMAIALALVQALTLGGCKKEAPKVENPTISELGWEYYFDEEGYLHIFKEVEPFVTYKQEPVTSMKITDEGSEEVTTYHTVANYEAPGYATRVEGTGADMRCYIEYVYYGEITEEEMKRIR